jgi:hypothetical protein
MRIRKLLLYTPPAHGASHRLETVVATVIPEQIIEMIHTAEGLAQRLARPQNGLEVAILLATSRAKLWELQSLEQMLERLRVILILPDTDPQSIAQAHSLRPRYLTNIQSDFQDVAAVLRKIMGYSRDILRNQRASTIQQTRFKGENEAV